MQGVIAAIPTPIDADGTPDKAMFLEHANWALDNGCDGLNVLGSTGEASTFSVQQRKQVMQWAAETLPYERLLVGTGTPALAETIELTTYASDLGFTVALVLPPYYYKPVSNAGIKDWYLALHRVLGHRALQIYFYNYPQMTGISLPVELISELNAQAPERFTGIKDSSGDLNYCAALVAAAPGLNVFPSSETALATGHKAGFSGCISATANITAPACARVWAAEGHATESDIATLKFRREKITQYPLIPAIKYLVGHRSGNKAWEHALPPFQPLTNPQRQVLNEVIATG